MSIYLLHIPRTSGIYVNYNVQPYLKSGRVEHYMSNRSLIDLEQIKKSKYVSGHFGTMPIEYMDNPTVFSIIRNPIEHFISYFKYTAGLIRTKNQINERLEDWLYGNQSVVQSNLQSKFLTGKTNVEKYNNELGGLQSQVNNAWFLEDYSLDVDKIKENINKFKCYTLENHSSFKNDFNVELKHQLGFTTFKYSEPVNRSHDIDIKFGKKEINRIEELTQVDMEIYKYVQEIEKR